MEWKKIAKKMLFPPGWFIIILVIISAVSLTFIFMNKLQKSPVSYVVYMLSFYGLSVVCIFLSRVLPRRYRNVKERIYNNPVGYRYMTDASYKTHISLHLSFGVNILYAGVNILSYILYQSMWFVILAVYYIILAVMRFLLMRYVRKVGIGKNRLGELKRARLCSGILLTVNFALTGAVMMILYQNKGFNYHGIMIYVMALYTFYVTIHAITDLIKYRKYNSPVMTTAKIIALSAALVSMLSLETAMLSQFGQDMSAKSKWLMTAITGAGVSIIVVSMSIYMIVCSRKEIKEYVS